MPTVNEQHDEDLDDDDLHLSHDTEHEDDDPDLDEEESEIEARARRMGHAPKSEWRGDPDKWIDAEEFIRRGEESLPILRERLKKQDGQIVELQDGFRKVIKNQGEFERTTRARMESEFEERKRKAVEEADTETYDQVAKEQEDWEKDASPAVPAEEAEGKTVDPEYPAFSERNPWYGTDDEMTNYANSMGGFVKANRPEVVGTPVFYEEIEKLVKRQYPDKFENPNRKRSTAVEGGRGPRVQKGKKGYADLPPAAKRACDDYVARGFVKDKAEYARTYSEEEQV